MRRPGGESASHLQGEDVSWSRFLFYPVRSGIAVVGFRGCLNCESFGFRVATYDSACNRVFGPIDRVEALIQCLLFSSFPAAIPSLSGPRLSYQLPPHYSEVIYERRQQSSSEPLSAHPMHSSR